MKLSLSEGIRTLLIKDFKDKYEFIDFVKNMHNLIPQFIKVADVKYLVKLERVGNHNEKLHDDR